MSKRQKGRQHRSVNRTPRPVRSRAVAAPTPTVAAAVRHDSPRIPAPAEPPPLGRSVARTYTGLTEAGARTVQELCEAVGYTPRTITRHLEDLARHGLAACSTDSRWTATRPQGTRAGGR